MEKFTIGLIVGAVGGALLTANNYKMRTLVKKSQEELQQKLDELMDEKIHAFECGENEVCEGQGCVERAKEKVQSHFSDMKKDVKNKVKDLADKVSDKMDEKDENQSDKK